ncbi:unnamed protein product [Caenorhabditis nigoni]
MKMQRSDSSGWDSLQPLAPLGYVLFGSLSYTTTSRILYPPNISSTPQSPQAPHPTQKLSSKNKKGNHQRSSQSTIFETISEGDELAEEADVQEESRRKELRRSRKRFSSTTYELSDFEESTDEANVQEDGEKDELREGEFKDPAPEVIPAEQVDDDTYAVYDEDGVQYYEVIGEEAEEF